MKKTGSKKSRDTVPLTPSPPPPDVVGVPSVPTTLLSAFSLFSSCYWASASLFFSKELRGCVIFCHLFIISHFDNFINWLNFNGSSTSTVGYFGELSKVFNNSGSPEFREYGMYNIRRSAMNLATEVKNLLIVPLK
jgi:hypothetical protein